MTSATICEIIVCDIQLTFAKHTFQDIHKFVIHCLWASNLDIIDMDRCDEVKFLFGSESHKQLFVVRQRYGTELAYDSS